MKLHFPKGFLWGTSTAAAQIETASAHNWRGVKSKDGYVFEETIAHEKHRIEDIEYIRQFGSIYRCGVDWARLQPSPFAPFDEEVVKEYTSFFQQLNEKEIQILFVIHHFTNPIWFEEKGGWLLEENIDAFVDYARQCIQVFGPYVSIWNTFNEPNVYVMNAYLLGNFPPFRKNILQSHTAVKHIGIAHQITYDLLKSNSPEKKVGISYNTGYFEGLNLPGKIPAMITDWWFNKFLATYFEKADFWGISYYAYVPFKPFPITEIDQPGKLDRLGIPHDKMWGYRPEGLGRILRFFYKKYKKPLLITENGICSSDDQRRIQSLRDYLKICHEVIEEGVPLIGYIHWSTFDNFEWHLGPTYTFGLVRVDYDTKKRKMTEAGIFYSKITRENAVDC